MRLMYLAQRGSLIRDRGVAFAAHLVGCACYWVLGYAVTALGVAVQVLPHDTEDSEVAQAATKARPEGVGRVGGTADPEPFRQEVKHGT